MEFTLLPQPAATGLNNYLEMVLERQGISGAMILRWIGDYKKDEVIPFFCGCVVCGGDCCCYDLLVAFGGLP